MPTEKQLKNLEKRKQFTSEYQPPKNGRKKGKTLRASLIEMLEGVEKTQLKLKQKEILAKLEELDEDTEEYARLKAEAQEYERQELDHYNVLAQNLIALAYGKDSDPNMKFKATCEILDRLDGRALQKAEVEHSGNLEGFVFKVITNEGTGSNEVSTDSH